MLAGSNTAEDDVFLVAIKMRSTTSFGGEVDPSVPCHKTLWHVKKTYRMKEILVAKFTDISQQVLLLRY
jgi:hypothetical protein